MLPVFIHGWAFSSKVFEGLRGIKPDLPAHGSNAKSYTSLRDVVTEIALSLPSRHDVVGWSLGGSIALLLALHFPSKVRRLFLIGTSPYFRGAWSESNLRAFRMMVRRKGVRAFREMICPDFNDRVEERSALKMLEDYMNLDLRSSIPYIDREVYLLQGARDSVVPVGEAFLLHNLLKRSKLIILPGGHFPAEHEKITLSSLLKGSGDLRAVGAASA